MGILGQVQQVVGSGLEHTSSEAVRRTRRHDEHGAVRRLLDGAVDEVESPVRVAGASDDEELRTGLLQRTPTLFEPVHDPDQLEPGNGRERGLHRLVVDAGVYRDERFHPVGHRYFNAL